MKTIYAIDLLLEDKFITVEIPVMIESEFYYHLDYDRLTYEQKYATGWNAVLDKDEDGTTNWTTNKSEFPKLAEKFIQNKLSELQKHVNLANASLIKATESAKGLYKEE